MIIKKSGDQGMLYEDFGGQETKLQHCYKAAKKSVHFLRVELCGCGPMA